MSTLTEFLTGIANAIRGKTGGTAQIPAQNFAAEIAAIQTGYDTSDATAGAAQILAPYTAYGASGKLTGTIPSQQAKTVTPGTSAQTAIPAGTYAAGAATVSGDPNLVPENIKEGVSIFGVAGSFAGGGGETVTVTFGTGGRPVTAMYTDANDNNATTQITGSQVKQIVVKKNTFIVAYGSGYFSVSPYTYYSDDFPYYKLAEGFLDETPGSDAQYSYAFFASANGTISWGFG